MKTTVELPEPLMLKAKEYARQTGRTFKDVLIEALNSVLPAEQRSENRAWWEDYAGAFVDCPEHTAAIEEAIAESRVIDPADWK